MVKAFGVRSGEVLLCSWEPIGVANEPDASGEYEAYVGGVYRLLASGASAHAIGEHLAHVETCQPGISRHRPEDAHLSCEETAEDQLSTGA